MRAGLPLTRAGRDPLYRFLLTAALLYLGWYLLYAFVLHPWGVLDHAVIGSLISVAGTILTLLGYDLIPEPVNADNIRTIGVEGGHLPFVIGGLEAFRHRHPPVFNSPRLQ